MGYLLPSKTTGNGHKTVDDERASDREIEKLVTENAQLRELVIQLTRIALRNVMERK